MNNDQWTASTNLVISPNRIVAVAKTSDDALILAASPDLIDACRLVLKALDDPYNDEVTLDKVKLVLKRALLKAGQL